MNPENTQENPVKTADQQLADIKAQTANIVQQAQKLDPAIKVSQADAEMIGLPKLRVPTQTETKPVAPELSRVGTTQIPATGTDKAREALLSQVPEADRDTISAILDASMGLETERGAQLEGDLESLTSQRLDLAQSAKDRAVERGQLSTDARLPELEAELESIRGEADVLSARRNAAIQAEARREGVSTSAQNANINAIEKDFNLQQANLAIRELASVGKVNAATKLIQTKLDIKYGDIEAETELVKAQIDSILPLLSREDAKVAEQRLLLNDVAQTTIADAREADKQLEEFKLQSYINAQQNGATPAILGMIMSSDNREDVASVGGTFIQDPLEKLQMRQAEASISASQASARASDALAAERWESVQPGGSYTTESGQILEIPVFDEWLSENVDVFGPLQPSEVAEYQKEYEDEVSIMQQAAKVASLSPLAREVVNNPQAYYNFTPTVKQEVFEEMAKAGLDTNQVITGKKSRLPATQAESLSQASNVKEDVEKLYTMLQDLPGTGPIAGRLQGLDPYNAKRVAIDAQITRIVPGLARGIFNEVGVLTDQDVERYRNTLANPNMTDAQIEMLHIDTLSKIDQSINSTLDTFNALGYDVSGISSLNQSNQTDETQLSDEDAYQLYLNQQQN